MTASAFIHFMPFHDNLGFHHFHALPWHLMLSSLSWSSMKTYAFIPFMVSHDNLCFHHFHTLPWQLVLSSLSWSSMTTCAFITFTPFHDNLQGPIMRVVVRSSGRNRWWRPGCCPQTPPWTPWAPCDTGFPARTTAVWKITHRWKGYQASFWMSDGTWYN